MFGNKKKFVDESKLYGGVTAGMDSDADNVDVNGGMSFDEETPDDNRYPDGNNPAASHGLFSDRRE